MDHQNIVNYLKALTINGVNQAQSGHPGGALSSIDFAYILHSEFLRYDPKDPHWLGRDRFVLSAGHESMLLYSLLFAQGLLNKEDLSNFRQLNSRTPGHPENHITPGVECTTGPLGQGAAMSVGFALAGKHFATKLGSLFNHKTYALLGDGCMQEEVTSGAAALAGHLKLNNLVWYYDQNKQQISGAIDRATSTDDCKMFEALGWNVQTIDGHDHEAIRKALENCQKQTDKPQLIIGKTTMAKGLASMEGSHLTHGAPLSKEERVATLKKWNIPSDQNFYWPSEAKDHYSTLNLKKQSDAEQWKQKLAEELEKNQEFRNLYRKHFETPPKALLPQTLKWKPESKVATRNVFGKVLEAWAHELPSLIGGSADLEPSNMTEAFAKKVSDFSANNYLGRNLAFGVREFTMSAVCNGMALHGGLTPFDATFLTFSDYSRAALRLGALQKAQVIHEFTHDSFYLGEDGPTHQPIEHIMSLRTIPDLYVFRPCDAVETEMVMRKAIELEAPSCICLSRQKLPVLSETEASKEQIKKGAWILRGGKQKAEIIFFATGSEVHLALKVAKSIEQKLNLSEKIKVVVLNSWELFFDQSKGYQELIFEKSCTKRVSLEAGCTLGWEKFIGLNGLSIGINSFGASAPAVDLEEAFGFTEAKVLDRVVAYYKGE